MTSSRGQIGPENVLAANLEALDDNNADGDNVDTSEVQAKHCRRPTELDEIHSYELLYKKMMNLFKEILLMFLVCIVYTVLTHDFNTPKVTRGPAAFPFFLRDSPVSDWYRGEVSSAITIGDKSDVGFIMFYAPWDAESQEVRAQFEQAALFLHGHVKFSAVNCWEPGSECRRKYNKVFKWPVFLAYTADGQAIQYTGPKTSIHMVKFLNNIMYPYRRVNSKQDILDMMVEYDAVVLMRVDCQAKSKTFLAAYVTALKFLEKDPMREIGFAILSKSLNQATEVKLYMWNETLIYPEDQPFMSRAIINWLSSHIHQLVMWLSPSGVKSQQIAFNLQGPTLILFTPQNPLLSQMDFYLSMKHAALEYYSCNNTLLTMPSEDHLKQGRKRFHDSYVDFLAHCAVPSNSKKKPVITLTPNILLYSNYSQSDELQCDLHASGISQQCCTNECLMTETKPNLACVPFNTPNNEAEVVQSIDRFATENLPMLYNKWDCNLLNILKDYQHVHYVDQAVHSRANLTLRGLSCVCNTSLNMVAMDSILYHHFAENLGLDILAHDRQTSMVLIDPKDEVHSVFHGNFSDRALREFIHNFTLSNLPRAIVDNENKYKRTHLYTRKECVDGQVCIEELNSKTFVPTTRNPAKAVIVLYYSLQCAYCSGISHAFLETARILANISVIQLCRIDGDRNTLPWEYTMDKYPSILLFPLFYKSESRLYPEQMPVTVPNLLSFVLANLEPYVKLQAMWEICNYYEREADRIQCISSLRRENLAYIEVTLRMWRKADLRTRQRILYKLQLLRNVHMQLAIQSSALKLLQQRIRGEFEHLSRSSLRNALVQFAGRQVKTWREDL